jgi:hypothetical protein
VQQLETELWEARKLQEAVQFELHMAHTRLEELEAS